MPIFEYICKECRHQFEALVYGKQKAECPKCHATKLEPQLSVFAVSAKGSSSPSAPSGGACGSCGDPRGPGACSLGDMNLIGGFVANRGVNPKGSLIAR